MGKNTPTRRVYFNRTMALAVATGMAFTGGVQVAHETNVAHADTITIDDSVEGLQYAHFKDVIGDKNAPVAVRFNGTRGYVVTLNANVSPEIYPRITREALETAGLDFSQPFTIDNISVGGGGFIAFSRGWSTGGGGYEGVTGVFVEKETYTIPDFEYLRISRRGEADVTHAPEYLRIKQGGKTIFFVTQKQNIGFSPADKTTLKPGEYASGEAPKIGARISSIGVGDVVARPSYRLRNDVAGFRLNRDGSFTYRPPADFAGGYVEAEIVATLDTGAGDYKIVNAEKEDYDYVESSAIYRFYVEPQPKSDLHVTVKDNKDGTYTLSKNDGSAPVTIKTKDGLQSVSQSGNTVTFTMADGSKKTINVGGQVTVTTNKDGTASISDGKTTVKVPTQDTYVTDVKKLTNGNYEVTRSDGRKWTIDLKELNDRITKLEKKNSPSRSEFNTLKNRVTTVEGDITNLKAADEKIQGDITNIRTDINKLGGRVTNLEKRVTAVEKATIKEVVENSDGTYTLIRKDDSNVPGKIDPRNGSVTNVRTDGKGNLVITIDGKDKTVPMEQVKVTESNKGKPNHTITITTPDGKSVSFNAFDVYVTDIKWNEKKGVYEVYRSDKGGGKTVWKTIDLSDLRKRVADLEAKESPTKEEFDKVKEDLDKAEKDIEGLKAEDKKIRGDITNIRNDIKKLGDRVTSLEGRVGKLENSSIKQVIRNDDGTYTLIRKDGSRVTGIIGDPREIKAITPNSDGSLTVVHVNGVAEKVDLTHTKVIESNKGKPNHTITITTPGGKPLTFNVYDNYVTEIKDLGGGKYTLVRKDGTQVEGTIDTTDGSVTKVKSDGKGNLVVTIDGKDQTVPLDKVKITEAHVGTPDHTVTIAVPGGKTVTFGVFDRHIDNVAKQGRGKYIVERNDGRNWTIDYSDLYDVAGDLTAKVADHEKRIKALEAHDKVQDAKISDLRKDVDRHTKELERVNTEIRDITKTIEDNKAGADDKFKKVNERIDKVRTDLGLLEVRVTSLEGRMALVEGRLDGVEDVQDKWAKCYSGAGIAALPVALSIPLYVLSQTHIPQVEAMNANIQKQIGVFNPQLAAMWRQQGGILQVTAALAGLAGTIGAIAYAANECKPYSETDAASKTPLGQMSSKVYAGSSRDDATPTETTTE